MYKLLHHCTFKSPIFGRFISGMATLPCAFKMRKGVNTADKRCANQLFTLKAANSAGTCGDVDLK